jgi:hypothetical protein
VSGLRVLLYKEWRDQRALVLGTLLLCALLVATARLLGGTRIDPHFREALLLQGCLAAFAVALSVEIVARDGQSGVDGTLTRLPISRPAVWLAKICFVAMASIACLAALALVEALILLAEQHPVLPGLLEMYQPTWWLAIAATAAACHASACVLRRSLPAALLGVALIVCVPFTATSLPIGRATEWIDLVLASWTPGALSALVCTGFLLGSLLTHRVRRPDVHGWRRAIQALLGVCIVVVPAVANSVRRGEWAFDILPFSTSAEIRAVSPSPDGKYLAVIAEQVWTPRMDWLPLTGSRTGTNCRMRHEVWILDPATGAVREIDDRFRSFAMDYPWDPKGHLVTVSTPGTFGDGEYTAERIDPSTAAVVTSHSESELDSRDYKYDFDRWFEESTNGDEREFSWHGRTTRLRLPREARVLPSPEPGIVFHESGNTLVRHDLADDSTRVLAAVHEPRSALLRVSPNGRYLLLGEGREMRVLDARDGHVVRELPKGSGLPEWSRVPGRIALLRTCHSFVNDWQVLLENGSVLMLPVYGGRVCEFGPDRVLTVHMSGIECMKLDGSDRQVLYQARP